MTQLTDRPFSKTQLFCSNLPWSVNSKMLRSSFEEHIAKEAAPGKPGKVLDAFVAFNGRSSRGFGYVTMERPEDATSALKLNGSKLGDTDERSREIRVEMVRRAAAARAARAAAREKAPSRPRGPA